MKTKKRERAGHKGGSELERLVEAWLQLAGWTTHRAAATGFNKFQKKGGGFGFAIKSHDLYGCLDLLGFKRGGLPETWAIQTTVPKDRAPRREKMAKHDWPISWRVSIITHACERDGRQTDHWFRVEDLQNGVWSEAEPVDVDVKVLEAHRRQKRAAENAEKLAARAAKKAKAIPVDSE